MKNLLIGLLSLHLFAILSSCQNSKKDLYKYDVSTKISSDSIHDLDSLVSLFRTKNVEIAKAYGYKATKIAEISGTPELEIRAYFTLGNAFSLYQPDSSFYYYSKALRLADSSGINTNKHKLLYNIGMLYASAYDFKTGEKLLDSALNLSIRQKDNTTISLCLNSLANLSTSLHDYNRSKLMYDSAYKVAKLDSSYCEMGEALANLALLEEDEKDFIKKSKKALEYISKGNGPDESKAYIYGSIAGKVSDADSIIFFSKKALSLVTPETTSELVISVYNNIAYAFLDKGKIDSAEFYIKDLAIPLAKSKNDLSWLSTIYDTYSDILRKKGDLYSANDYQKEAFLSLIKADESHAGNQARLLTAMLDLNRKESIIKENKTQLEKSVTTRNSIIVASLSVILILISVSVIVLQKRKTLLHQIQLRAAKIIIESEENEKIKLGREFHDLIGQKLVGLKNSLETASFTYSKEAEETKHKLSEVNEIIRNLSHKISSKWLERFSLEDSITCLCSDCRNISPVDLTLLMAPLPEINSEAKLHLYRIIQEILTNCNKYAGSSKVFIDISCDKNIIRIKYRDSGPGFVYDKVKSTGIGISNIIERVNLLNGKIQINSRPGYGTYYNILIPV